MQANTYIPCDLLQPWVKAIVITETTDENTYKVLPDTGLVIGFQYKGKLTYVHDGKSIALEPSGFSGLHDTYRIFRNSANIGTCLVYFKEGGAVPFFRQPLHELFRESISLESFMLRSELLIVEEQLCEAQTEAQRIEVIEQFLIARMRPVMPDKLVLSALAVIHKSKGNIRIRELASALHTSQSPLEKRFRQVVGASPKKFASIVRLKHAIQQYNPQDLLTNLGYEAGFYDQAHFIKEFKAFTGQTPEDFFSGQ